ncbi:MAG TPA: alpha/beta hydrolase [Gemmatimonadaceae bacterium]|jgi:Predicted hydrolases or acyltransferases (alpha/beta hydrolase superfamily)
MKVRLSLFSVAILWLLLFTGPASAQLIHDEPEWYLPTGDGCRLFVQEFGQGRDTIIVLHGGWGAEHGYLLDAFTGVVDSHHLVFYDQRGSLRSPCPDSLISVDKHVQDLERLRSELGVARPTLVGHSMGTYLALDYLQQHPTNVKGLVLLGALPPKRSGSGLERQIAQEQEVEVRAFFERPEIGAELHAHGLDRSEGELSAKEESSGWRIRFAGINLYHVERWPQMKGGRAFYNEQAGAAAAKTVPELYDFTPAIAAHRCPVWAIMGDHDYLDIGARQHRRLAAGIANYRVSVLENAGHFAWVDAPQEFRRTLGEALEAIGRCE